MTYPEKLSIAVRSSQSTLCVGLDPNLALIPKFLDGRFSNKAELVVAFCKQVIDATVDSCAAYKPNLAFFESLGEEGFQALSEVIRHIPTNRIIVADAKRGDISSTAEHYKLAFFDQFNVDAVTLNPLMGFETLDAFSKYPEKGVYVLALTSNPGAMDFLKKNFEGFEMMAQYIANGLFELSTNMETHLGMVIGATQADLAHSVIRHHKNASLLIPGIGAQGGSIQDLEKALRGHLGIPLINSSRGIIYAGNDTELWQKSVSKAAEDMKAALSNITRKYV